MQFVYVTIYKPVFLSVYSVPITFIQSSNIKKI